MMRVASLSTVNQMAKLGATTAVASSALARRHFATNTSGSSSDQQQVKSSSAGSNATSDASASNKASSSSSSNATQDQQHQHPMPWSWGPSAQRLNDPNGELFFTHMNRYMEDVMKKNGWEKRPVADQAASQQQQSEKFEWVRPDGTKMGEGCGQPGGSCFGHPFFGRPLFHPGWGYSGCHHHAAGAGYPQPPVVFWRPFSFGSFLLRVMWFTALFYTSMWLISSLLGFNRCHSSSCFIRRPLYPDEEGSHHGGMFYHGRPFHFDQEGKAVWDQRTLASPNNGVADDSSSSAASSSSKNVQID